MTHFEYIAAAHTLMLTFAAARLLAGVPHAVQPSRVAWVHVSWLGMAIFWCAGSFWAFWGYRPVEWTLPRLLFLLSTPALIYVFSSLVSPSAPAEVPSWRDYFFKVRAPLFSSGALLVVSILLSNQVLLGISPLHFTQVELYGVLAIYITGAIVSKVWVHNLLAVLPWLSIARLLLGDFSQPDWVDR